MMGCNRCLSWSLLTSYAGLLVIGSFGLYLSIVNFGHEEPLPPTPPPDDSNTTTTTTTPNPYGYDNSYNYRHRHDEVPESYQQYVRATWKSANMIYDARLYVLVPSVSCIVVAALVVMCGLYSRQFFSYTFSLYSSVVLWVLTFTWTLIYQNKVSWNSHDNLENVWWILGTHGALLLLLFTQIVLCVCELRHKKAGWPTFNFTSLFTVEAVLLTARLTLVVYTLMAMAYGQILTGFRGLDDPRYESYENVGLRYPRWLALAFCSVLCYNVVAILESTLSMLLGKVHSRITTTTTLISAVCCIAAAVICSPVFVRMQLTPMYIWTSTFYLCVGLSVATLLHLITCIGLPVASRTPPQVFVNLGRSVMEALKSFGGTLTTEGPWNVEIPKIKCSNNMTINLISAIFSIVSIMIVAIVWDSPMYRAWGSMLVLCANSATLVRTLPPAIVEYGYKQREDIPLRQRVIAMSLECAALFVGAIAIFVQCYYGAEIFGGVINLLFCFFQTFIILRLMKGKKLSSLLSRESERLVESPEESSEGSNDEENPTEVMA